MTNNHRGLRRHALELQLLLLLTLTGCGVPCGPGRGSGHGRRLRKTTPLVFKQHVPNVSENTLGASGPAEKRITRDSEQFKQLVTNYNSYIQFKDEEGTGADRIMSKRCKDKLNTLAIAVMNRWENVQLRVVDAWVEDNSADGPLHYEGRAVDITTSDRDRSKYGMLARLAVQAGFDWVYYVSRAHIHVSVKSDSSITIKTGGCFHGDSMVLLPSGGALTMSELRVGDRVLAMSPQGRLEYSEVYLFLDVGRDTRATFVTLTTADGSQVTTTPGHMVYVSDATGSNDPTTAVATFAGRVRVGQFLFLADRSNATFRHSRIVDVSARSDVGVYAPLTKHGTIIVDDVLASCYALFDSPTVAHWSFAPARWYYDAWQYFRRKSPRAQEQFAVAAVPSQAGVHWYADVLHAVGRTLFSDQCFYSH